MQADEFLTSASRRDALERYQIPAWSDGYVDINPQGQLIIYPNGRQSQADQTGVVLSDVITRLREQGMHTPVLIRFPEILEHRVRTLTNAFASAIQAHNYQGFYTPVYPIKVNQHRRVVETLARAHPNAGLEAGSKPELMAVLALIDSPNRTIVCNGYKDKDYIRIALSAQQLGYNVIIVIEKLSECQLTLAIAAEMGVTPQLGIRLRLASISKGKWQNSGGHRSKFGLTAANSLKCIDYCRQQKMLHCLRVLHIHLGSQVANIRDIQAGLAETARFYAEIKQLGAPIETIDVGGGLGVDYQGSHSRDDCSMNYTLEEYASKVVHAFSDICQQTQLPQPNIITESGRAMTAHHAILLVDLIDSEQPFAAENIAPPSADAPSVMTDLYQRLQQCRAHNAVETFHDAQFALSESQSLFTHGILSLQQRAFVEQLYYSLAAKIRGFLSANVKSHQIILDQLNTQLAKRLYANFSIFQSLPDIWAIRQIFPICPIEGLNQPLTQQAIIHDITCDSDGRIDHYIDGQEINNTITLPATDTDEHPVLGFFLAGAYQEILGDMHNLFGDTHTVHVVQDNRDPAGFKLIEPVAGQTVADVLAYVQFDAEHLLEIVEHKIAAASSLADEQKQDMLTLLRASLDGYTYLAD